MRELNIGTKKHTRVIVLDEPGAGGACHEYKVTSAHGDQNPPYAVVHFQNGPVKEVGQNGCFQERTMDREARGVEGTSQK